MIAKLRAVLPPPGPGPPEARVRIPVQGPFTAPFLTEKLLRGPRLPGGSGPSIALRLRAYTAVVQDGLVRHKKAPVPMVLHTGYSRWTAERSAAGLTASTAGMERWRPGFDYLLVDARECAKGGPTGWSEVKALFQLGVAAVEQWEGILAQLEERLGGPEDRSLSETFGKAATVAMQREHPGAEWSDRHTLKGARNTLRERVAEWKQEKVQERVQIGLREGVCETLVEVARDRFGEAVASEVGSRIADANGGQDLARVRRMITDFHARMEP